MLKSQTIHLPGRDTRRPVTLTELPALVADRYARTALAAVGAPTDGGVIALTFTHLPAVLALGEAALPLLEPFVVADRQPLDWRNVLGLQRAALTLHAGFLISRPRLPIPVAMQVEAAKQSGPGDEDLRVHFCSPTIASVLHSGRATYRDLETVLSTEDAYNLAELANVEAIRDWRAHQTTKAHR